jgi:uncharacterized protein YceK
MSEEIMKKMYAVFAVFMAISVGSGCATIVNGTTQKISFSSYPSGATVSVNGTSKGITPIIAELERGTAQNLKIELKGFIPYETTLTKTTSGWVWGNILFGGIVGVVIDATNGAMYRLTPEQLNVELKKSDSALLSSDDLYVSVTLDPDPAWEKLGHRLEMIR